MTISKYIINFRFHFIVALSLILFIFHLSNDLDVNSQYFVNINKIEVVEAEEDGFFTFDPNEYFEEDNVPQNSTKNNQLKQSEDKINNTSKSKVEVSNRNEDNYKNTTKNKNTNDINAINQSTDISNYTSNDFNLATVGDWDCNSETDDTVDNIIKQDPEFVLALGDLSYNGKLNAG